MDERYLALGVVVLVLVVVAVGAFVTGVGPAPGGDGGSAPERTPSVTGTVYDGDGSESDSGEGNDVGPPFTFTIDSIEECGQTCRDVTATVTNQRNETTTGITIYTRIYAGNTTDSSDRVWSGTQDVGTLEAGESFTSTRRVELTLMEGRKVQNNDGWITVVTTVESDGSTITFESRQDVI